jgi:hypothetical protein
MMPLSRQILFFGKVEMVTALVGGFCFLAKKLVFTKNLHHENRELDMLMTSAYEMI